MVTYLEIVTTAIIISRKKQYQKKGSSFGNNRKKYHQYSNISYGYASNDIESDKVVVENTFQQVSRIFHLFYHVLR